MTDCGPVCQERRGFGLFGLGVRAAPRDGRIRQLTVMFHIWELRSVRIAGEKRLREFIAREPRSAFVIWNWVEAIESGSWRNPGELNRIFSVTAYFVGEKTVFVSGNHDRIEAFVHYRKQIVYIKRIGTLKE